MPTLSEKILDAAANHSVLKSKLEQLDLQLSDVLKSLEADNADEGVLMPQVEELTNQVDELRPQVDASAKKLDSLKKAEQSLAARAIPVGQAPAFVRSTPKLGSDYKPGDMFVKIALVKAIAHFNRQNENEVLDSLYHDNDAVKAVFNWQRRAAVMPADSTTSGWASQLVRDDIRGFLDMLSTVSIGAALASRSMQLSFDGATSITIPRMNQTGTPQTEPAWVGEGGVIPLQQFSFGSASLNRFKLASIVPMTNELIQAATPQAEVVMKRGMEQAYTIMLDTAFLSAAAAVSGVRPAGMLNGVTVGTADTTGGYASVVADIKTLLGALKAAGVGQRPVLVLNDQDAMAVGMLMNPLGQLPFRDDMASGRLLGVEVAASQNATKGTAIMVDVAHLATVFDGPEFAVSEQAALSLANAGAAAPTHATGAAGIIGTAGQVPQDGGIPLSGGSGAATVGALGLSLFQTYSTAIRGIWPTSWAFLRDGCVAAVNTLKW